MTDSICRLLQTLPLPEGYQLTEQGCYRYLLNGQQQAIAEPWVIALSPRGQSLIHSARFIDSQDTALLVAQQQAQPLRTALNSSAQGNFQCKILWRQVGQADIRVQYQFRQHNRLLQISREDDAGLSNCQIHKAEPFLYFPLLRIFSGPVIRQLAWCGPLPTVVPDINTPTARDALLQPTEELRSAQLLAEEQLVLNGQSYQAQKYNYVSQRYLPQDKAAFWIDHRGLLLKYGWQQSPEQCWLVELATHQLHAPNLYPMNHQ